MKDNQLQLVDFKTAKKLKELGFDYPTYNYYYTDGRLFNNVQGSFIDWNKLGGVYLSAPEISLVFQWLSDEKKIHVSLIANRCGYKKWTIKGRGILSREGDVIDNAESEALTKALELLTP